MVSIAVLLTCFNRRPFTLKCLRMLYAQYLPRDVSMSVYLVDDGSQDGTYEAVEKEFQQVCLLKGNGNLFWNRGMHAAFQRAAEDQSDFYLWLNDDTFLFENALKKLLEDYNTCAGQTRNDRCIIVGATKEPQSDAMSYGAYVVDRSLGRFRFRMVGPTGRPVECSTMCGNCVLIPAQVVNHIGLIDPRFKHRWGDVDYGLRATSQDCSVWLSSHFVGECEGNPLSEQWRENSLGFRQRIKLLNSIKGLEKEDWLLFNRKHGSFLWPLNWISPYARVMVTSLIMIFKKTPLHLYYFKCMKSALSLPEQRKNLFISWVVYQRRTESIAQFYDLDVYYHYYSWEEKSKLHKSFSYLFKFYHTLQQLFRQKPEIVFIQLAPAPLLYAAAIYCYLYKAIYISDCHNTMLYDGPWLHFPCAKRLLSQSAAVLVHNKDVFNKMADMRLPLVLLHDPIPSIHIDPSIEILGKLNIKKDTYIIVPCSYASDEPIEELFTAIRATPNIMFVSTWFTERIPKEVKDRLPSNVILTGYLIESEFNALYANAAAAIVLTNREGTQPSGASEAIALGIPLIISDISTTRRLYSEAAIFVNNHVESIREGIQITMADQEGIRYRMSKLRAKLDKANTQELFLMVEQIVVLHTKLRNVVSSA